MWRASNDVAPSSRHLLPHPVGITACELPQSAARDVDVDDSARPSTKPTRHIHPPHPTCHALPASRCCTRGVAWVRARLLNHALDPAPRRYYEETPFLLGGWGGTGLLARRIHLAAPWPPLEASGAVAVFVRVGRSPWNLVRQWWMSGCVRCSSSSSAYPPVLAPSRGHTPFTLALCSASQ